MEVCSLLPVPLDRPVPKHVLSRRGAISFSSNSSLFGAPDPRQLSQPTFEIHCKSQFPSTMTMSHTTKVITGTDVDLCRASPAVEGYPCEDRLVPKHVLSRRGAISFSSSSSLFGAPDPRQLSQ
ncbi:unnamed protein product, partial [Gadus morhua 'NCC']